MGCQFEYGDSTNGGVTGFEEAPVTGKKDCAYYAKWAGQLYLNELIGLPTIDNTLGSATAGQDMHTQVYTSWWQQGNQEYSVALDDGVCQESTTGNVPTNCNFWAGRNDQEKCADRVRQIQD